MSNKNKRLAIIPAFNESDNILNTINDLVKNYPVIDILVVNDASTDNTTEIVKSTKAFIIDLSINLGIGGAVQTGFKFAMLNNYDIALQFDGDGQHKANEIENLLNPIINNEADVVIGSRFIDKADGFKSTKLRRVGIKLFEIVSKRLIGKAVTDCTSGFRAYNRRTIELLANNYPSDYPEPEAVILLGKKCFRIQEVFVTMQERQGGVSSISGLKSIYYMIKVLLAMLMQFMRK